MTSKSFTTASNDPSEGPLRKDTADSAKSTDFAKSPLFTMNSLPSRSKTAEERRSSLLRGSDLGLLRQKAMLPVNTVNPFIGTWSSVEGPYNQIKTIVLFPLAILRLFLVLLLAIICAGWCRLALIGVKSPEDIGWFRRFVVINPGVRVLCRAFLFVFGFYWIPVKGKPDPRARVMIANHTTMLDVVVLLYTVAPAFLSKATVLKVPLIGTICEAMQVIGVDRANQADKEKTKQNMKDHITLKGSPPLLVFPEGTTCRYDTVLRFKPGAFDFGLPVQPILLHWRWNFTDPSSCATTSLKLWAFQMLCQFYHYVEVEYLPVLEPDQSEQSNALFYANNARKVVLQGLQRRAAKPTYSPGFVHDVFAVQQSVDDFLVWRRLLAANMTNLKETLQTFSLESVRDAIELAAPVLSSRKRIDLSFALASSERYARIWHSSTIPGHTHKSLLGYDDLTHCLLGDSVASKIKQIFTTAFVESAVFPSLSTTPDAIDFRQFTTALIWLSNCSAVWGKPFQVFEDAPMDPAVVKWASVRSRIAFAYLCSHQVMKDDLKRGDCVQILGQEAGAWWDAVFQSDAKVEDDQSTSEESSLRLEMNQFKDGLVNALTAIIPDSAEINHPSSGATESSRGNGGEDYTKEWNAKRGAYALIEQCFSKIDARFRSNYYEQGSFFLTEHETKNIHDKVVPMIRAESEEAVVKDPAENVV